MASEHKYAVEEKGKDDDDSVDRSDVSSGDEYDSESDIDEAGGLTDNQKRLLYLMSLYTSPAESGLDQESWIRKQALMVLIYEGVVAKVFDYDYAPSSEVVEGRRMYFNFSQEGSSDVDFLREEELLNGLKVMSKDYTPVTCFQISVKGLDTVRLVPRADKEAVHTLAFSPFRAIMNVSWQQGQYWLIADADDEDGNEYRVPSSVTQTEDVSYVSSAYIPACLRQGGRPTMSNAHRATESAQSGSNLRDELDVVITLNSVSVVVAEYIPFGANQMVELNHHVGATDRVQGGFLTGNVDDNASGTQFHMDPGMTAVQILDYSLSNHVNFEADIRMPEDEGIVQVETFGCSINSYGTCFYGLQLEAVMDKVKDGISLDHLSRLLADVQIDSSRLVDSSLTRTQRDLVDLVFRGDGINRNKVNLLVANEIVPHLTSEEYMDKGEYENELKQVLGSTRAAYDISQYDTLIFGEHGILLAGPNSRTYEPLLCCYLQFLSLDLFVRNYFNRLMLDLDEVRNINRLLEESLEDPLSHVDAKQRIPKTQHDLILAEKLLAYLTEGLEEMGIPPAPKVQAGRNLFERLQLERMQMDLARRITDAAKSLREVKEELELCIFREQEVTLTLRQQVQKEISSSTAESKKLIKPLMEQNHTLVMIMTLLAGSLSFDFLDRLTGTWSIVDEEWFQEAAKTLFGTATLWFGISLVVWLFVASCMCYLVRRHHRRGFTGLVSFRSQMNHAMSLTRFNEYLENKKLQTEYWDVRTVNDRIHVSWIENDKTTWGGTLPQLTLEYSAHLSLIHAVSAVYNKNIAKADTAFNAVELRERVLDELRQAGVIVRDNKAPKVVFGPLKQSEIRAKAEATTRALPPKRMEALAAREEDNMVDE